LKIVASQIQLHDMSREYSDWYPFLLTLITES